MNNEEKILQTLSEINARLDRVEADTRWTRMEIEKSIKPNIQKLADGHMQIIETMARKEDVDALREDWATERVAMEALAIERFGK